MRGRVGWAVLTAVTVAGTALTVTAVATSPPGAGPSDTIETAAATTTVAATAALPPLQWKPCFRKDYPRMTCSSVALPMNYANPTGKKVRIAISRIPHTTKASQGVLLVNPGGPGGSGLTLNGDLAPLLGKVGRSYDLIGFDPRGVGLSRPALTCNTTLLAAPRPPSVPDDAAAEDANVARVRQFAQDCGRKYGSDLKYFDTISTVRDMDAVRVALRAPQISYYGGSYGTYLGAVYAKLFPSRVKRMVMDSSVDPTRVWYPAGLDQTPAFERRNRAFIDWIAKHDQAFDLGTDPEKVAATFYKLRTRLITKPAGGLVGPAEFEDTFVQGGYEKELWPYLGVAFSDYVHGSTKNLVSIWKAIARTTAADYNLFSVYQAVTCRDARMPRDWKTYHDDATRLAVDNPLFAWSNTWYAAPCAFWPVAGQTPLDVATTKVPQVLMVQSTGDAATPYEGAMRMHAAMGGSRLVVEEDGGNHGIAFAGNRCIDSYVLTYLTNGRRPSLSGPVDARCATTKDPQPLTRTVAGASIPRLAGAGAGTALAVRRLG
jgi:pimeloyl-ACP methyl ester carboxylesterase